MHKATLTIRSPFAGEYVSIVESDDKSRLYARIVGTVEGATLAGAVVAGISIEEVSA